MWDILHGPLSIIFGVLAGIGAALICAPTKLWNNAYKRTSVVFLLGQPAPPPNHPVEASCYAPFKSQSL